jgi:hypothetical protein
MKYLAVLALAACGGDPTAEGDHHHYVVSQMRLPASAAEAPMLALPLQDGGGRNNKFGAALAGLPLGPITNAAIQHGDLSLLLDLQTRDLVDASAAGVTIRFGENPNPTPCTAPDSCGHHLTGTGTFDIAFGGTDETLLGDVIGGTFSSAPNITSIQLGFQRGRPLDIDLLTARVELTGLGDTTIQKGIIAGVISRDFIVGELLLEMKIGFDGFIGDDCSLAPDSTCMCTTGSLGEQIHFAFGQDPIGGCTLSDELFMAHPGIQALMQSDVSVDGVAGVTFGIGIAGVAAEF